MNWFKRTVTGDQDGDDETVDLTCGALSEVARGTDEVARTAMIPAMITGTTHFIMRSGRRTDMAEMPTPDFAVP